MPAFLALLLLLPLASAAIDPWEDPARILVISNASLSDSEIVAQYYALRRGVPADHLLSLPLPTTIDMSWSSFLTDLRDPVLAWLATHRETSVDTLLFVYGVPYQIDVPGWGPRSVDSALCVPNALGTEEAPSFQPTKVNSPYREVSPGVGTDKGHFDHALYDFEDTPLYLHCRLDGLSAEHAKALVDRAAYGRAHVTTSPLGYTGTGYVDTRFELYADQFLLDNYPFGYLSYANADLSMAFGKFFVEDAGFPLQWEPYETEIGEPGALFASGVPATTAPDALFYGGWYNFAKYPGGFEWKTGSFACDLNSNSAQGLRSAATSSFLCQAFQQNLTAGAGVIAEPYLDGHSRPDVFLFYVMVQRFPWAEAAMLSDPGVKWMELHVGDPLYRIDPAGAVADTTASTPFAWLAPGSDGLELELPAVPVDAPGGAEVFRATAIAAGASPLLATTSVVQPDFRRLQSVAIPPTGSAGLSYAQASFEDPTGNAGATSVLHFVAGPAAPALGLVETPDPGTPAFDFAFGAAGGLASGVVTGFSIRATAPAYGLTDFPIESLALSLASTHLATRSLDQVSFTLAFLPGVLKPGPFTLEVSLTANGQTSSSSATALVP